MPTMFYVRVLGGPTLSNVRHLGWCLRGTTEAGPLLMLLSSLCRYRPELTAFALGWVLSFRRAPKDACDPDSTHPAFK